MNVSREHEEMMSLMEDVVDQIFVLNSFEEIPDLAIQQWCERYRFMEPWLNDSEMCYRLVSDTVQTALDILEMLREERTC